MEPWIYIIIFKENKEFKVLYIKQAFSGGTMHSTHLAILTTLLEPVLAALQKFTPNIGFGCS